MRDRGILSRLGARRDARQDRVARPAPNGQPGPRPAPPPGAAGAPRSAGPAANALPNLSQPGISQPELAPELERDLADRPITGPLAAPGALAGPGAVRSARYAAPGDRARGSVQLAAGSTPLLPNHLPYAGPGVALRLPEDIPGVVNYLIDDAEQLAIGAGEEQHLRAKGRYEIRFSRGIDDTGRSYGEARYTISEGAYRFAVTENGWELFREPDQDATSPLEPLQAAVPAPRESSLPESSLREASSLESSSLGFSPPEPRVTLEPSQQSELRHRSAVSSEPSENGDGAETLPPPTPVPTLRSILERQSDSSP